MLDVPIRTLRTWEAEFPQLSPKRCGTHRRYSEADMELLRYIKGLFSKRRLTYDSARGKLGATYRRPEHGEPFECTSPKDAAALLRQAGELSDNVHASRRIEAVVAWLESLDSSADDNSIAIKDIESQEDV